MKRRTVAADTPDAAVGGIPVWVLDSASVLAAVEELGAREAAAGRRPVAEGWEEAGGHVVPDRLHVLRRERRAAGEAWCAQRGLSFSMVVMGALAPSAPEWATGCTGGARRAPGGRRSGPVRR